MTDDQKIKLAIEKRDNIQEQIEKKEHFLEEDYETPVSPERREQQKNSESSSETSEELFSEKVGEGDDIVAQGIYNQQQAARTKEIEKVLEKDLGDIYVSLPPEKQRQFKIIGEETAIAINDLFNTGKLKIKRIIDLIRKWLSIIPGVNKFFLEQETKIKADEIIKISNKDL
jgi:hypothetical protein